jgi:hypothetical protein
MSGEGRSQRILITRPANATPYTAEDGIGDTTGSAIMQFTDLLSPGQTFLLMSAHLEYHVAAVPAGCTFRLELFNASPTAIADNGPWNIAAGDRAKHIGTVTLGAPVAKGGTPAALTVDVDIINKMIKAGATRTLFVVPVASGGFTPAGNSETLALTLSGAPI